MAGYRRILVAVDLGEDAADLVHRARRVADSGEAIHLVFVFEPVDTLYYGMVPGAAVVTNLGQVEREVHENVKKRFADFADSQGIPGERCHMPTGSPAQQIRQLADDGDFDLIVMGAHTERGVRRLLGATANRVLHNVDCDVLAVRLDAED